MNFALYLCLMVGFCSLANSRRPQKVLRALFHSTILDFGVHLYKQFAASTPPGTNIFFSPVSISASLALLSLGARSVTRTQILEGLGFKLTRTQEKDIHAEFRRFFSALTCANDQILLDIGQVLFLKDGVKPLQKFMHDVNESYTADVSTVNFKEPNKAEKVINDFVEKKTHGKITGLVNGLDPETAMMIVNYIFFKGTWRKPFNPKLTRERDFFVNKETIVKVPMMFRDGSFEFYFDRKLHCTVLRMYYSATASALFILPDKGKFKQVEDALSGDNINKWMKNVRRGTAGVYIPRFTISTTHELKESLNSLGIDLFSDQTDLSGITGTRELKVSKVTHKAVLTVNEKGTEAAGATAIEMITKSMPSRIVFDRPFFTVLIYKYSFLFLGKVENPTLS